MVGTHRGPFRFFCPYCGAAPTKPCVEIKGRRKGKTCKTHSHRVQAFRKATYGHMDDMKGELLSAFETKRSKH